MKNSALLLLLTTSGSALFAQTPPCGVTVVQPAGENVEERFIPAPIEHVRANVYRALPSLAARLVKTEGDVITAKTDFKIKTMINDEIKNSGLDPRLGIGSAAAGKHTIQLRQDTVNGVAGTRIHVEFHKNALVGRLGNQKLAAPLIDEVECLCKTLSAADPFRNPRGPEPAASTANTLSTVQLPAGSLVKVALREYLYSRELKDKGRAPTPILFEVVEDVMIDNAVVIRKGALAVGKLTDVKGTGRVQKSGIIQFQIESVTAVDGKPIKVDGEVVWTGPRRSGPALGVDIYLITKGRDALVRAGTVFEVTTAGGSTIELGR